MEKYLVQIEFRYSSDMSKDKITTIGVFDTFEEACINGNNLLRFLESKYNLHMFPNGIKAIKERFSKNGGCFESKKTLVSNLAYLQTPFGFYAKIETLHYISNFEDLFN